MSKEDIVKKIEIIKNDRNAVILAHNYQPPEIQDIADHLGDSLELSRIASKLENEVIVFCGVHFMAETAAILSPEKKVILPDRTAGCPMADMLSDGELASLKARHPDAIVVSYVNSSAKVKALTDICCTSANAIDVVKSVAEDREIIFGPDHYLGSWVAEQTGRNMIIWNGYCPSHQLIGVREIEALKNRHPDALVMVHPEASKEVVSAADAVLGTGGMIRFAGESKAKTFIVGTEVGMVYRLQKEYPDKTFIPASPRAVCDNMKKITLEKVLASLERLEPVITVEPEIADKARNAIERMIETGR